jgi:hypothetical protein
MTDNDQRVDPRYDPAFQRGFQGKVASGLRSSAAVRRTALVSPAPYRVNHDKQEPRPQEDGTVEAEPTRSAAEEEPAATPEHVAVAPVAMRQLLRNPFLVALLVIGGGMTFGGLGWANQARLLVTERRGAATDLDYWFLQASVVGAPLTIVAGIGIIAGVLFIAAAAWNRRPPGTRADR